MRSRLHHIRNWEELAEPSRYSAKKLATLCGTSLRHLERYFLETFRQKPHEWLARLRQAKARRLIMARRPVKEVAARLYYKSVASFSREFKRVHGSNPSELQSPDFEL